MCSWTLLDWAIDPPRRVTLISRIAALVSARSARRSDFPVPLDPYQRTMLFWLPK